MHIAITGAEGFVGRGLAGRLAREAALGGRPITRLTLLDLSATTACDAPFVAQAAGDIADAAWLCQALDTPIDALFHLASVPGGTAEQDYALGRRVNLDATTALLELCKSQVDAGGGPACVVFASSIAVFGEFPALVDDDTPTRPLMTYGAQKLVGEVLVADFSRRGWIDGRSPRISGVLARPPARTGQLSAFMSDLLRELAAGRPFSCPTSADATTWVSSLECLVDNLVHAATVPGQALAGRRAFTLPTLRCSMGELADAVGRVHGTPVRELVRFEPVERIERLFGRQPPLKTPAALALGFRHDADIDTLVRRALAAPGALAPGEPS